MKMKLFIGILVLNFLPLLHLVMNHIHQINLEYNNEGKSKKKLLKKNL